VPASATNGTEIVSKRKTRPGFLDAIKRALVLLCRMMTNNIRMCDDGRWEGWLEWRGKPSPNLRLPAPGSEFWHSNNREKHI